jgi:DNA polymerase-1
MLQIFDFSQLELKVSAQVWKDPVWIEANNTGDVHEATRKMMASHWPDLDMGEQRVRAKGGNFGAIYQSRGKHIEEQNHLPEGEGAKIVRHMRLTYPGLFAMIEATKWEAKHSGKLVSITGRERKFYFGHSRKRDEEELRQAANWAVQGPAAELTYLAMVEVDQWLGECGMGLGKALGHRGKHTTAAPLLVSNVHDAIILDVPPERTREVASSVKSIMEDLPTECEFGWVPVCPLKVDVKEGLNWGELKRVVV